MKKPNFKNKVKKWLGPVLAACLMAFSSNLFSQEGSFDFGAGLGIPYGVLGANIEYYPIDNLSVSAGLGTTILADVGYDLGLQYYFTTEGSWTPRLSIHYGTNGILESISSEDNESFEGVSIGAGVKKLWSRHGLALDIFYIVSSDLFDRKDELEEEGFSVESEGFGSDRIKIGVGYVFSF